MSDRPEPSKEGEDPNIQVLLLGMFAALVRARRFLVLGGVLFLALTAGIILLVPLSYDAKATVLFTSTNSSHSDALSLLKESGLGGILGQDGPNLDQAGTLLESDKLAFWAFHRFNLDTSWRPKKAKDTLTPEEISKLWFGQFHYEINEKEALELTFRSKSPRLSAEVVEGICGWLDSITQAIHQEQIRKNLQFIESQLALQTAAFDSAQARLLLFQKRNRIVSLPDQVQATVEGSAKLESEALMADIRAKAAASTSGQGSSEAQRWADYRDQLRAEAKKVISNPGSAGAFQGLEQGMDKFMEIGKLQRDVAARKAVFTFLSQQREQLLLDNRRSIPTLFVLDHPFVPRKRATPPRRPLFYLAFVAWVLGASAFVIVRDSLGKRRWSDGERESLLVILQLVPIRSLRGAIARGLNLHEGPQ